MKKKIFAVLLTGLMAVSVAACSNSNSNSNNTSTDSQPTSSVVSEESKLAEITKTDKTKDDYLTDTKLYNCFYAKTLSDSVHATISGNLEMNGSSMSIDIDVQKQGDKQYASMKMLGMSMTTITKDGYTYTLNDATKTYTKAEALVSDSSDDSMSSLEMVGSLEDFVFVENDFSTEEGTTDYEKYSTEEATITAYFDGDNIKYMDIEALESADGSESSGIQSYRLNLSATTEIDESLFEIPNGYTEESEDADDDIDFDFDSDLDIDIE